MVPMNCEVPLAFSSWPYGALETRNSDAATRWFDDSLALPPSMMMISERLVQAGSFADRPAGRLKPTRSFRSTTPPGSVLVRSKYITACSSSGLVQPVAAVHRLPWDCAIERRSASSYWLSGGWRTPYSVLSVASSRRYEPLYSGLPSPSRSVAP